MGGKQSLQDLKISRRKKERRGRVREEGQVNDPHFNVFNAGKETPRRRRHRKRCPTNGCDCDWEREKDVRVTSAK